jgi:hypothetical protein
VQVRGRASVRALLGNIMADSRFSVSAVLGGTFVYRGSRGRALMSSGSLLPAALTSDQGPAFQAASPAEERRIAAVLRNLDVDVSEPLSLARLAGAADMSRYYFLRAFHRVTGQTPWPREISRRSPELCWMLRLPRDSAVFPSSRDGFNGISASRRLSTAAGNRATAPRSEPAALHTDYFNPALLPPRPAGRLSLGLFWNSDIRATRVSRTTALWKHALAIMRQLSLMKLNLR